MFEFALLEWLWDVGSVQVNLPGGVERKSSGSYSEVVALLSTLGDQGWDVATCAAAGNWLIWTLRRKAQREAT